MGTYITRRILISIPVLIGITFVAFAALSLAPGDPLAARIDPAVMATMSEGQLNAARSALGLDKPIPVRWAIWLGDVIRGDLGYSILTRRPVLPDLTARLGPTLLLMTTALVVAVLTGIPLGIVAALRQYSRLDYVLSGLSAAFISIPGFVMGLAAIYVFAVWLKVLPSGGMVTLGQPFSIGDLAAHMVLPVAILSLFTAAQLMRYTRASMLEVLTSDYMTTARAKGLVPHLVIVRHAFRNALIPVITIIGLTLPEVVAGAVITEQVFTWPGMGQLAVKAAGDRDPSVLMGVVLIIGTAVLVSNLLADVAYGVADPRVRLARARG